jgi:hypothetical protein
MIRSRIRDDPTRLRELFGIESESIVGHIIRADQTLKDLRDTLRTQTQAIWDTDGVGYDTYPSGQRELTGFVESSDLSFAIELDGDPDSKSWEIVVKVLVQSSAPLDEGQDVAQVVAFELANPEEAAARFESAALELAALALSRVPSADSWRTP